MDGGLTSVLGATGDQTVAQQRILITTEFSPLPADPASDAAGNGVAAADAGTSRGPTATPQPGHTALPLATGLAPVIPLSTTGHAGQPQDRRDESQVAGWLVARTAEADARPGVAFAQPVAPMGTPQRPAIARPAARPTDAVSATDPDVAAGQSDTATARGLTIAESRHQAAAPQTAAAPAGSSPAAPETTVPRPAADQAVAMSSLFDRVHVNQGLAPGGIIPDAIFGTAAPADPLPQRPQTPLLAQHVAQQLAVSLRQSSDRVTEMALDPVELGKVRMTVRAQDQAIVMTVVAERPETADLMRRHVDVLQQELRALGYTSVTLDFSAGQGQSAFDRADQTPHDHDGGRASADPSDTFDAADAAPAMAARGADGSLDLRL
jgi:hypothetical protein